MAAILTAQGLEKSFGVRRILDGVSFAVEERDRIALVGVNGAGKSTLLRMLAGEGAEGGRDEGPDAGLITRRRGLSIEYVAQEPRLDPERSVGDTLRDGLREHAAAMARLEELGGKLAELSGGALDAALAEQAALHDRLGAAGWDQEHELRGLAAALDVPPMDAKIGRLSIGERRRVALARALLARPELLALDEPTNHLDAATIAWLEARLTQHAGALLLVTHDRYFLDRVATRVLELDRGKLYAYEGGYRRFLELQAERLDAESEKERKRAAFVRREIDWIRRGPQARTTKQQARIDRFDAAVAAKPGAGDLRSGPAVLRLPGGDRLGKTILELKKVSKRQAGKLLFEDLELVFKKGDRVGVVGPNGAGKTTLVRAILGQTGVDAGEIIVGQNTQFGFLDQGRAELDDTRTVLQEVAGDSDTVFLEDGPVHARTFLKMLLFDDGFADTPVGALSGGERNRVQLAKLLRRGANFLILDEPTNDLDVMTLGVLEEALAAFGGCALVVSHDRWFLDKVATAILAFEGDGRVTLYEGNCSDYLARRARTQAEAAAATAAAAAAATAATAAATASATAATPTGRPARVREKKMSFKDKQELAAMEATIEAAEAEVARLETTLADPNLYAARGAEVPGLVAALDAARARVEGLYARWQELEAVAAAAPPD